MNRSALRQSNLNMSKMNDTIWTHMNNAIHTQKFDIIYFSIGCSMSNYYYDDEIDNEEKKNNNKMLITEKNNQQYPEFLNNYKKKLIVLIDPELEKDLQIIKYYNMIYKSLDIITGENLKFTVYSNDEDVVITAREYFIFKENIKYLYDIIAHCISSRTKLVVQDFTGNYLSEHYENILNIFDKNDVFKNILFDVTYNNGGCYVELPNKLLIDDNNDFVQPKYMLLHKINDDKLRNLQKKIRLDYINYPLIYTYMNFEKTKSYERDYKTIFDNYKVYFMIYGIDIDFNKISNYEYGSVHILLLINNVIDDAIKTAKYNISVSDVDSVIINKDINKFREYIKLLKT